MSTVDPKAPAGQESVPSALPWCNAEVAGLWLAGLRSAFADIKAVTEDQQRPPRERRIGHLEAVRITQEAFTTIDEEFGYASRGLVLLPRGA